MSFTYEQAIIIGFIQGLTELFPISSLGHAILIPAWIGGSFREFISEENQAYLLITIAMHLASSVALFLVFRKRWLGLFAGTFRAIKNRNYQSTPFRVLGYIVIATIPVGEREAPEFGILKSNNENVITSFIEKPKKEVLKDWVSDTGDA